MVAAPHNRGSDKVYNGVGGYLYAIMGKIFMDLGYGGFIWGRVANKNLLEDYIKEFGAKPFSGTGYYTFQIDEEAMKELIDKYNFEWREWK